MASSRFSGSVSIPSSARCVGGRLVQVERCSGRRVELALDPVEARGQQHGGGEVRVAGAVDRAVLDPPGRRHAQHLRAVVVGVGDVDRRPRRARARVADLQPLVGVDGRRGDRDVGLGVRHQAGDEVVALLAEPEPARVVGRVGVEHVAVAVPEAHVEVAAVAGQVRERLRHERRDQPALLRERLDHVAEEDRAVAGDERVVVLEVLLELAVGVLVVGRVDVPAERVDMPRDVGDEAERARQRAHVVTGLVEVVERVGELDPAVLAAGARGSTRARSPILKSKPSSLRRAPAGCAGSCAGSTATARPRP